MYLVIPIQNRETMKRMLNCAVYHNYFRGITSLPPYPIVGQTMIGYKFKQG